MLVDVNEYADKLIKLHFAGRVDLVDFCFHSVVKSFR